MTDKNEGKGEYLAQRRMAIREQLFPNLDEKKLWHRKRSKGFTTIPRTMALICRAMDEMSKGFPISTTYLDLWCKVFDESYVKITDHQERAFCAGFGGQRAILSWKRRIQILKNLGFVDTATGSGGELSHAVIFNPHLVIRDHFQKETPGLTKETFNALVVFAAEIGAADMQSSKENK